VAILATGEMNDMQVNTTTTRRIQVTNDDMERLRELIRGSRRTARWDQGHLATLDQELDRADVVDAENVASDVVTMHSVVRVLDLDSGLKATYTVVFPADADIERRRLSVLAPIGTALIGYRAGDEIEWATPGGTRRLRIEDVLYQPEAAAA
jgi:regulator of nucleoside diphosphate kinase